MFLKNFCRLRIGRRVKRLESLELIINRDFACVCGGENEIELLIIFIQEGICLLLSINRNNIKIEMDEHMKMGCDINSFNLVRAFWM